MYCIYTDKNIGTTNKNDVSSMSNIILAIGLILMTILLFYAAEGVVITGLNIASRLGISSTIIGIVLIAIGTSLPELAATVAAIVKKKPDLVVGNVIGSNILNIGLVIPIFGFVIYLQNKKPFRNLKIIKFGGFLFVFGYFVYILFLANIL